VDDPPDATETLIPVVFDAIEVDVDAVIPVAAPLIEVEVDTPTEIPVDADLVGYGPFPVP
jgi:hypothetical protein